MRIKDRIMTALQNNGGRLVYWKLAEEVFPKDQYPRAWNYPTRGGPPGCYMVLSRAIREHDFGTHFDSDAPVVYSEIYIKSRPRNEATP